jgi:hypothetical protein
MEDFTKRNIGRTLPTYATILSLLCLVTYLQRDVELSLLSLVACFETLQRDVEVFERVTLNVMCVFVFL